MGDYQSRGNPETGGRISCARPDVIVAAGTLTVAPMMQATKVIPIVFPIAIDPLGAGFVSSLSHPGGNVTGFMTMEYSLSGKWPELLKRIAPDVRRLGVLRDATQSSGTSQFAVIQAVAPLLGIEVVPINMLDAEGIERAVGNFGQAPNGGLIVTGGGVAVRYRNLIVTLAAKWKLPAIYFERSFTAIGGLLSYGPNQISYFGKVPAMSIASSGVKSPPSRQCRPRPNTSSLSTAKRRSRLDLMCHHRCLRPPTR